MLIALTIMWLSGGGAGSWFFSQDFTDRVELVVMDENRQSQITEMFDQINDSSNAYNKDIEDIAGQISKLNRNPETADEQLQEVLQQVLQRRNEIQRILVDVRMKLTDHMQQNEWEKIFADELSSE
jgi:predicted  nucleic acid-binding Zn-ribbon protein